MGPMEADVGAGRVTQDATAGAEEGIAGLLAAGVARRVQLPIALIEGVSGRR